MIVTQPLNDPTTLDLWSTATSGYLRTVEVPNVTDNYVIAITPAGRDVLTGAAATSKGYQTLSLYTLS